MMRKAFPYMLVKASCLLSRTVFYIVSSQIPYIREKFNVCGLKTKFLES